MASWATLLSVVLGFLIAYPLARQRFWGRDAVIGLVNLPLVLPPTVLGYALLVAVGRRSLFGEWYEKLIGQPLVFSWQGAVIASCVASLPLFIGHARIALAIIDPDLIGAARCDGAARWALLTRIFMPLAGPGLIAGTTLAFARALGDFGATLMVAGDTPGRTQTMSLAIYDALNDDPHLAIVFTMVSTVLCLIICITAARLSSRYGA